MYSSICSKLHFSSSRYACGSTFCMVIYFTAEQGKRLISPQMNANRRKFKKQSKKFLFAFFAFICEKLFSSTEDTFDRMIQLTAGIRRLVDIASSGP